MIESTPLEESRAIQRRTGRTFHVATRLFPREMRHATYVLYAFFRVADDVVDDPDPQPPAAQRAALARIREAALGRRETDDPVLSAFASLRERYDIPDREVEEFLAAMEADIEHDGYETAADLEGYLRGSAVAVAYMMLHVTGAADNDDARAPAKALGEAFQLTNFLRDVREDVREYDRVYLPRESLAAHGVDADAVRRLEYTPGFAAAMAAELERTESLYREGVAGIRELPDGAQLPVLLAAVLYADYHRLIRERDFDVLAATPELTMRRRLTLLARTWWHWRRSRDPEAVFAAVSDVELDPDGRGDDFADPAPASRRSRVLAAVDSLLPFRPSE